MFRISSFIPFLAFFFLNTTYASSYQEEYQHLDRLALEAGADKSSSYHNYTEVYARYFASLKEKPIKFLEIGIHKGASVKLWENYFKNGQLHFIDITLKCNEYTPLKAQYHLVNQESTQELGRFIEKTGGNFDIIIDDGGHTMNQQITSFRCLFPHLKSGGMYIIEDLHTSYWKQFGGGNHPGTTINFLKKLIDDVNYIGTTTTKASHLGITPCSSGPNYYRENIFSMHFYDSLVVILKK